MLITSGIVARKTQAGRTATVRPTTILLTSNIDQDNLTARRTQRLVDHFGLTEHRARIVADLAFGGDHARG